MLLQCSCQYYDDMYLYTYATSMYSCYSNCWLLYDYCALTFYYNCCIGSPKPSLKHSTNDWLFPHVTLLIVRLAGLANVDVSGEVTWGNTPATPLLATELGLPPGTHKSISQSTPWLSDKLWLQVNVILPSFGTTYPPGAGSVSADRVTIYRTDRLSESQCVQNVLWHDTSSQCTNLHQLKYT